MSRCVSVLLCVVWTGAWLPLLYIKGKPLRSTLQGRWRERKRRGNGYNPQIITRLPLISLFPCREQFRWRFPWHPSTLLMPRGWSFFMRLREHISYRMTSSPDLIRSARCKVRVKWHNGIHCAHPVLLIVRRVVTCLRADVTAWCPLPAVSYTGWIEARVHSSSARHGFK